MTGRNIARGIGDVAEMPPPKTPLSAALQITASQRVNGIITASQVLRRWLWLSSVRSSPSQKPSPINPWMKTRKATVVMPLAAMTGTA